MNVGKMPAALLVNGVVTQVRKAHPADVNASAKQESPRYSMQSPKVTGCLGVLDRL